MRVLRSTKHYRVGNVDCRICIALGEKNDSFLHARRETNEIGNIPPPHCSRRKVGMRQKKEICVFRLLGKCEKTKVHSTIYCAKWLFSLVVGKVELLFQYQKRTHARKRSPYINTDALRSALRRGRSWKKSFWYRVGGRRKNRLLGHI